MSPSAAPVVFVHGLWLHADSWAPWVERFREAGYSAVALGWPGDGDSVADTREHPERVAGHGIDDVVAHHLAVIRGLEAKPVVVGHSFGGLIAQRLLAEGHAAAAVAIDAAPIKGVLALPLSALRVASVALRNRRTGTGPSRSRGSSSDTGSGTRSPRRSRRSCTSAGRSRPRGGRCSRLRSRASRRTRPPRCGRTERAAALCS